MIPSPVNLSTVPPKRSTPSERTRKNRSMTRAQSSGSSPSARSMEPATSAKRTVTCLRSPSGGGDAGGGGVGAAGGDEGVASSGWPQPPQKRSPTRAGRPQAVQFTGSGAPQAVQKRTSTA